MCMAVPTPILWIAYSDYNLSTRALQQNVAEDAESVEAYYAQKSPPCPESEAEILVIQADGKGIPMVLEEDEVAEAQVRLGKGQKHGHKKEAIVTTVYTIKAAPRTPTEVIASFFKENQPKKKLKKRFQATKQAYLGDIGRKRRCALAFDQTGGIARRSAHPLSDCLMRWV